MYRYDSFLCEGLTEWLINLIEKLLLEVLVFDELTDASQTFGNLIGR